MAAKFAMVAAPQRLAAPGLVVRSMRLKAGPIFLYLCCLRRFHFQFVQYLSYFQLVG